VLLGIQEHNLAKEEAGLVMGTKRKRLGAVALVFPLIYNLVDALSIAAIGVTVSDASEYSIPDNDFFIFECGAFVVVAICVWLYMLIVKKYAYNPFDEEELVRCGAASGETVGTMTFIFAASKNPVLTAPITSLYCIVTIILGRIFLKERLTKKQYRCLALLLIGILFLGISEIFHV
jgi:drug/metabolite transporter (DMT)-like permease